jgi:hypothetical protein
MPTTRQGAFAGVVGPKICVVGGVNDSSFLNVNEVCDTTIDSWTTAAPMPTARYVPAGAVVNNILYVIGGKLTGRQLNVVEAYDPATDAWSTNYSPMLTARDSITAVVYNGIIYVIGGFSNGGDRLKVVESYNPATDAWTEEAPLSVGKSSSATGLLGSTIVAAGLADSGASGDDEGYESSTGSWKTLISDPTARWGGCSASISGQLYFASGRINAGSVNLVESFNLEENKWPTLTPISLATVEPGEATAGGFPYCIGGSSTGDVGQGEVYDNVQIYRPAASPSVNAFGRVNNANFAPGSTPLAPGTIAAIFGSSLDDGSMDAFSFFASDGKLINSLGGASVTFSGVTTPVPIFSAFPQQLNIEIPQELAGATSATIQVTVNGQTSAAQFVPLGPYSPGIFTVPPGGTGQGAIQIANSATYAAPEGSVPGSLTRPGSNR